MNHHKLYYSLFIIPEFGSYQGHAEKAFRSTEVLNLKAIGRD